LRSSASACRAAQRQTRRRARLDAQPSPALRALPDRFHIAQSSSVDGGVARNVNSCSRRASISAFMEAPPLLPAPMHPVRAQSARAR
jgi:hypothetical protein